MFNADDDEIINNDDNKINFENNVNNNDDEIIINNDNKILRA